MQSNQTTETYITYENFEPEQLTCTPPEKKAIPNLVPEQNYYQIPLMYNRGNTDVKNIDQFMLEGCVFESSFGIQTKPGPGGKIDNSIMCRLKTSNPGHLKFITTFNAIHRRCADILAPAKGTVKMPHFRATDPEATGLKSPIYRAIDETTGSPIEGRDPSIFFKLFSRGKEPYGEQTLFTNLKGEQIPWSLLKNVDLKFIPLIHVKRIYIGSGKASIQMEVISAIILEARARNTATQQMTTMKRLQEENPDLVDSVSAQLAKLATDRQDQMLGVPSSGTPVPVGANQPTFTGIVPSNQESRVTMTSLPESKIIVPNLADFTASAPMRYS